MRDVKCVYSRGKVCVCERQTRFKGYTASHSNGFAHLEIIPQKQ